MKMFVLGKMCFLVRKLVPSCSVYSLFLKLLRRVGFKKGGVLITRWVSLVLPFFLFLAFALLLGYPSKGGICREPLFAYLLSLD